jgi:tRNA pseudouridine38-40 synthase
VNGDLLPEAAKPFLGTHDFSAFGSPTTPKGTTVRTVIQAEWMQTEKDGTWHFEVKADAFLYRMVRRLVFVQVAVAQGKCPAESISRSLAGQGTAGTRSELPAALAPAYGLTLVEVTYPTLESIGQQE